MLTPEAFEFVLGNKLKRATRSQTFLTLVVMETAFDEPAAGEDAVRHVARIVSREVRETDLLTRADEGVSLVLLDADMNNTMRVIDRSMARLDHYEFPRPVSITVGAAASPTHPLVLSEDTDRSKKRGGTRRPFFTYRSREQRSAGSPASDLQFARRPFREPARRRPFYCTMNVAVPIGFASTHRAASRPPLPGKSSSARQ